MCTFSLQNSHHVFEISFYISGSTFHFQLLMAFENFALHVYVFVFSLKIQKKESWFEQRKQPIKQYETRPNSIVKVWIEMPLFSWHATQLS